MSGPARLGSRVPGSPVAECRDPALRVRLPVGAKVTGRAGRIDGSPKTTHSRPVRQRLGPSRLALDPNLDSRSGNSAGTFLRRKRRLRAGISAGQRLESPDVAAQSTHRYDRLRRKANCSGFLTWIRAITPA